jgi:hypothetical protein
MNDIHRGATPATVPALQSTFGEDTARQIDDHVRQPGQSVPGEVRRHFGAGQRQGAGMGDLRQRTVPGSRRRNPFAPLPWRSGLPIRRFPIRHQHHPRRGNVAARGNPICVNVNRTRN